MVRVAVECGNAIILLTLRPLIHSQVTAIFQKMKLYKISLALICILLSSHLTQSVFAQASMREIRLTVFLDYAHPGTDSEGTAIFDGTIDSLDNSLPNLQEFGFNQKYIEPLGDDGKKWSIQGSINSARLTFPRTDKWYHLYLGPLSWSPNDNLTLIIPFVNLDYQHIVPPPDNLAELVMQAARPPDDNSAPTLFELKYNGAKVNKAEFDIPFLPIRKQIDLVLTPLVGEMLLQRPASFRLSGHVIFDQIHDYGEFSWDCPRDPALQVHRYNASHLLFALDSPPGLITSGMLSSIYQSKPTFTFVRMDPLNCSFDAKKGGQVDVAFNGQIESQSDPAFPKDWVDTIECNALECNKLPAPTSREYILEMGEIVLAPGDILTVTIPGVEIHQIDPPPTRTSSILGHTTEMVFEGPLYSKLKFVYEPDAGLILSQLHTAMRTATREIERVLGPFWGGNAVILPRDSYLTRRLGILAVLLFASSIVIRNKKISLQIEAFAWILGSLVLFYGLRGGYGLLAIAVFIYLKVALASRPFGNYVVRGAIASLLIFTAMFLDRFAAANLFAVLRVLEIETTPITPLILFVVGFGLGALLIFPNPQFVRIFPRIILAIVLALVPLALFDAMQQSLLSLTVLGIGIAYLIHRLRNEHEKMSYNDVASRLKLAWTNRLVPIGFIILILFAAQNGLQSTSAVLGSMPIFLRAFLPPLLLFISILTSFLAMGLLFILLYPILPFNIGYLKAAIFGLFLLLIFFVGIGADENLASTWQTLMIGRMVYYLGVPILIGLFFDATTAQASSANTVNGAQPASDSRLTVKAISEQLKDLRIFLSTVGSIATLIAPSIYAYFAGQPLLINYFDLLQSLVSLAGK